VEADDVTGTTPDRWIAKLGAGLLAVGLALGSAGAAPVRLGLVYDEDPELPGTLETAGRSLASGDLVKALNTGAVVRLDNGHVLKLTSNSSALIEAGESGQVAVTVLSGRVAMVDEMGRLRVAGQQSRFTVSPTQQDAEAAEGQLLRSDPGDPVHREAEPTPRSRSEPGRP
jgi:hypothetical protein